MPRRLPTPCTYPGCPDLSHESRCPEHRRADDIRERDRRYDAERRLNADFYASSRWRRLRTGVLHRTPLCAECERRNRVTLAKIVHHVVPVREGGAPYALDNLEPVCRPCHGRLHGSGGRGGNPHPRENPVIGGLMEQKAGPMKQEGIESEGGA
jgi:5-methylcytosine-specific restriction enzyme A